jgi:Protein of unknown function (DUF2851)
MGRGVTETRHGRSHGSVRMRDSNDLHVYTSLYRDLCDEISVVAEREERYEPTSSDDQPSEHLLHLLWQRQELLRRPLMTLDHQPITIYRPGRWSRSSGPDFWDAKLRWGDGPIRVGEVEMHVLASDWFRHGHDQDMAYTRVLLHVVWRNDLDAQTVVDASGREIPQLALSTALTTPLSELQIVLDDERLSIGQVASMTPCQRSLLEMTPETIGHLLDMAGEERWRQKANRFALRVERRGVEQALYESMLEALGFKGNRMPFWQLARLAPVARLREALALVQPTPIHFQAILYGVSGFLQQWQNSLRKTQSESQAYVTTLTRHWEPMGQLFPETLDERQWRLVGIRPANFPQRRIAATGYLLADLSQHSLMDSFFTPLRTIEAQASRGQLRRCIKDLTWRLCVAEEEDFWSRRYAIDGPELSRVVDLLGLGRATTIVVDVLLPAAAALAQLSCEPISLEAVRALYLCHPRLPANEITREMIQQFFGADHARAAIVNSACRQQGLMQLYRDFCLNELETCQDCAFPRLVARLERLQRDTFPAGP